MVRGSRRQARGSDVKTAKPKRQTLLEFITETRPKLFKHGLEPEHMDTDEELWALKLLVSFQEAELGFKPEYDGTGERRWLCTLLEAGWKHIEYGGGLWSLCPPEVQKRAGGVEVELTVWCGTERRFQLPNVLGSVPVFNALAA